MHRSLPVMTGERESRCVCKSFLKKPMNDMGFYMAFYSDSAG